MTNTNAQDKQSKTPLHFEAQWNTTPEVIKVLAEAGANIYAQNKHGDTPLHLAAQ